jgi:hypothetical protein
LDYSNFWCESVSVLQTVSTLAWHKPAQVDKLTLKTGQSDAQDIDIQFMI